MNLKEAQDLLKVDRYISQKDLKKRYISLIKIHHPDVNLDKKKANRLTSEIIEAFEYFKDYREAEQWVEMDASKAQEKSTGQEQENNSYYQNSYSEDDWESAIDKTPLEQNPFWDSTLIFNYDLIPECLICLEIDTRFPNEKLVLKSYKDLIRKHHPSQNPKDSSAIEKCRNIYLAFAASINLREQEGWSQMGFNDEASESNQMDSDQDYSNNRSKYASSQNQNSTPNNSEASEEETISLSSLWWPNTPTWFKAISIIVILAIAYNRFEPDIWVNTEYGRKKWIGKVVKEILSKRYPDGHKVVVQDLDFDQGENGDVRTGSALIVVDSRSNPFKIVFKSALTEDVDEGRRSYKMNVEIQESLTLEGPQRFRELYREPKIARERRIKNERESQERSIKEKKEFNQWFDKEEKKAANEALQEALIEEMMENMARQRR